MMNHRFLIVSVALFSFLLVGCKTDHSKKKDAEYLFWNASLKTENSFIKQAVKEINQVEGESLVVEKYNSPESKEEVIKFFTTYTRDRRIAEAILRNSIKYDVPPTLAFSLSRAESAFNPNAINKNRVSIDRGLFQLNSSTFRNLTLSQFFDIDTNTEHGVRYIRRCLDMGTNEISALAMYNAGSGRVSGRGTPRMTLNYISKIQGYRADLLDDFNLAMNSLFRIDASSRKVVKDVTLPLDRE